MTPGSGETAAAILRRCIEERAAARDLDLTRADLRGALLLRLRADGLVLVEADLRGAVLANARWTACKLAGARLDEASFADARLRMCDLDGVSGVKAVFAAARIENCTARGAKLDDADLRGAILTETDFARSSLRGANLQRAKASGANLRGADLAGADLTDADLTGADLRGADLSGANLELTELGGADLRGAIGAPAEPPDAGDEDAPAPAMPTEWQPLAAAMTPVVAEILRTSGRRGSLDPETAARLARELEAGAGRSPELPVATINAVTRVLGALGADVLPALLAALHEPGGEPPEKVKELLRRLGDELGAPAGGTADEILARLRGK